MKIIDSFIKKKKKKKWEMLSYFFKTKYFFILNNPLVSDELFLSMECMFTLYLSCHSILKVFYCTVHLSIHCLAKNIYKF